MRQTTFELYRGDDEITDDLLQEAATLFSENYGIWGPKAVQHVGPFAKTGQYSSN